MRISYLKRTDRQTDGEKSALVELRFAAKNLGGQREEEHQVVNHVQREQHQSYLFRRLPFNNLSLMSKSFSEKK